MAVTRDSVATLQITCGNCGTRLRYTGADVKVPSRERSRIHESVPAEAALYREITCVQCNGAVSVPIPATDPANQRKEPWPEPPPQAVVPIIPAPGQVVT